MKKSPSVLPVTTWQNLPCAFLRQIRGAAVAGNTTVLAANSTLTVPNVRAVGGNSPSRTRQRDFQITPRRSAQTERLFYGLKNARIHAQTQGRQKSVVCADFMETVKPLASNVRPLMPASETLPKLFYWTPWVLQTAIWPLVRPLFRFFIRLEIRGAENLKLLTNKQGTIFAVSHSSELDSVLVPASLPFLSPLSPMFYTSRESAFYINSSWRRYFYGGCLFKLWGAHRLHSGKHNYEVSLQTHIQLLEAGKSLCMFPDGKQLPENEVGTHAHGGVGFLAWRTGAITIPVRITGIYRPSTYEFLTRKRTAVVAFGKPIHSSELFAGNEQPTVDEVRKIVELVVNEIRKL
ncbi:MAG: lysophospholipid acyltransferase family protein [bacterium]|nr:lysophospholipid acyltransferase family protein [bacterium]